MDDTFRAIDAPKCSDTLGGARFVLAGSMEKPPEPASGGRPSADTPATASGDTASMQLANALKLLSPSAHVCKQVISTEVAIGPGCPALGACKCAIS